MTPTAILGWALLPATAIDRWNFARRYWWAPLFGIALQIPWFIYGWSLRPEGLGVCAMSVGIGGFYLWNLKKWLRERKHGKP